MLAATLGRRLVRLQCYEGLDLSSAVYEWNYPRQMLEIRLAEATGPEGSRGDKDSLGRDLFSSDFLIERPLLQALKPDPQGAPVLLIDELDRTDEPLRPTCWKYCRISRSPYRKSVRSRPPNRQSSSSHRTGPVKSMTR